MSITPNSIALNIILEQPPADLVYSLQKGAGAKYEPVQVQSSKGGNLEFDLVVEIKGNPGTHDLPDFRGPYVQGPVGGRFIYLDIGSYAGGGGWSGRLKIPLTGVTWQQINLGTELHTAVPGTGKNGLPNCATVKSFVGWKAK
ncbi:DUF5990 family protein [Mucilaginibacter segetis]|uniref:Uncharacterized protein n=1 Tax=Mucilaginibacter segetis TaxID=2793071 RepID=A0A934ULP4_9SPHI|nr:DUF5990 family protein [Mucilaginibacter segetis]MBK0378803.1 hypothetical protein [Mucilaginibacter segetis]